jgi:hypothetical protein
MSYWRSFGVAIFVAVGLLAETAGSAHAQCSLDQCAVEWSGGNVKVLGSGQAYGINDAGQAVGVSFVGVRH